MRTRETVRSFDRLRQTVLIVFLRAAAGRSLSRSVNIKAQKTPFNRIEFDNFASRDQY